MRSYNINFDKLVNQLTPHYLGGRKYVLWLQSLCHPLKSLNDAFKEWAVEKRIEASMTSQTIMLEWFLNHKFNKYFKNKIDSFHIIDSYNSGVPMYWQEATATDKCTIYNYGETADSTHPNVELYYERERESKYPTSFLVLVPEIDYTKLTSDEIERMITYWVKTYSISGKTFNLIFQ